MQFGRRTEASAQARLLRPDYSEMGSEKFSNSAKSGCNKGTIRSDMRYLVVSKDVRRHRSVTAEVASSSLVVPAILSKTVRLNSTAALASAENTSDSTARCASC